MKTKVSPAVVGMFVLGALALGVIALLSFGGLSLFSRPQRFMVYFDESVHGLDLGSPVKLSGVRVGRVVDLAIRYDDTTKRSVVAVICELNRNVITDLKGVQLKVNGPDDVKMMVDHGLRAQLGVLGLATGLLFVELDFVDPHEYPAPANVESAKYVVVPAIRGAFSEAQANLLEISNKLKRVDFEGLARDFRTLLTSTNRKVNELDVKTLNEKIGHAADAVTNLAQSEDIKQTLANLNATLAAARAAMEKLDGQVGPVSDDLKKTLADAQSALKTIESTAVSTNRFVRQQGQLGDELTLALRQVAEAASALENLASAIERNPSSLLVGKKKPEK